MDNRNRLGTEKATETQIELQQHQRTDQIISALIKEIIFPPALSAAWVIGDDSLGYPWPIHHCAEYKPSPTLTRLGQKDLSGGILSYLSGNDAEQLSKFIDQRIERDYAVEIQTAQAREKRSSRKTSWIVRQDPYHNCKTAERGIITERIPDADILKKFGSANS